MGIRASTSHSRWPWRWYGCFVPRFTGWRCSISRSFGVHRYSFSCSCSTMDCRNCSPIFVGMDAWDRRHRQSDLHFCRLHGRVDRAAILSIQKARWKRPLGIGMSWLQAIRRIILPQAARIATPSLMTTSST